jgi:TolB-like protein/class 3 adenylate cyclase/Tfp pilus assembly protein PilF
MSVEIKKEIQLEIAHVLFTDIVGYSKLPINEQRALVERLNEIVRSTDEFQAAETAGRLIKIPTGDGITLVFYQSPEAPVECALEISRALKKYPELQLRMGIHSGPVSGVIDVTGKANVAGAGINMAQRVMDCGDAGHILLSKRVAEDLEQYPHWQPHLHELGECEVKHGVRLSVVNLYTEELGNPAVPERLKAARVAVAARRKQAIFRRLSLGVLTLLAAIAAIGFLFFRYAPRFARTGLAVPEKSIAVLPFENLSEEKSNAYFADGVQDEILTNLARIADLKVISRTSVMLYKAGNARNLREIGQQLGVAHVVEGSVQRSGNRVRVNAQLVDAPTDKHLWAQTYDRDLSDVFAIQSEIAKTIADQLEAKLSPAEKNAIERAPTSDINAFDLYTRAKNLHSRVFLASTAKSEFLQEVDLLNQAVVRDRSFFDAYCQLVYAHDALYFFYDHNPARLALAEAALQAAAGVRPDAGETHLARAWNLYWGYLDDDGALAELEVAVRVLPNEPRIFELMGYVRRRQGRWEESIRNLERAIALDPRNINTLQQTALSYHNVRRYAEATSLMARVLAFEPNDVVTRASLALVEFDWTADTRALRETVDSIRVKNPAAMPSIAEFWLIYALADRDAVAAKNAVLACGEEIELGFENVNFNRPFVEGVIARMTREDDKARAAFTAARAEQEKVVQAQPSYGRALCVLGLIDAGLGRKEDALREGRRAVELLPVARDASDSAELVKYLAMIAAWVGEKDLACEKLASIIHRPGPLTYGDLKLMPYWDPLRGDPRFEKIVASLAPKEAGRK